MKKLLLSFAFFYLFTGIIPVFAQHENDTWYFGNQRGIKFSNGSSSLVFTNDKQTGATASISDKNTGDLLFYTNGFYVWDKNNDYLKGGEGIHKFAMTNSSPTCIIVPMPGSSTKYYIISYGYNSPAGLAYAMVDMAANGGKGEVIEKQKFITWLGWDFVNVVKHSYNNSYWMVVMDYEGYFYAYNISESGFSTKPVISGPLAITDTEVLHNIITSPDGTKFLVSYAFYNTAPNATGHYYVFDFDKTCGVMNNPVHLDRAHPHWHTTHSVCFSPDSKKLYAAFYNSLSGSFQKNILVQYHGDDFKDFDSVIQLEGTRFGDMQLGPDNQIYITVDGGIDAIEKPDNNAHNCGYKPFYYSFANDQLGAKTKLPSFICDRTLPGPSKDNPGLTVSIQGICPGDSTRFGILPPLIPDSVKWDFGDVNSPMNTSNLFNPAHLYTETGNFEVRVVWYKCGIEVKQSLPVKIQDFKYLDLGPDTTFCYKDSFILVSNIAEANHTWSSGDKSTSITVKKPGIYWLMVESGACKATDSVELKELPLILIEIGEEYTICDDDNELVTLDAGKGYKNYLWTPTGDTTQWIIVKKTGDYYVVVEDFRGCMGDDDAKVLRLCNFTFFIPNSFTPNGDGRNDVFKPTFSDITDYTIEIYNLWGEKIFESNDPTQGWDGIYNDKACPIGAYMWQLHFKGFHNKLLRNYNHNGVVHLVR